MNQLKINQITIEFVRAIISECLVHPADFAREIGIAERLKDTARAVGVSKGSAIGPIVKGQLKGAAMAVVEAETSRWEALSATAAVMGVRLASLLKTCGVETGDRTLPSLRQDAGDLT